MRTIFTAKEPLPDLCCLGLETVDLQAAVGQSFWQSECILVMLPDMCCGERPKQTSVGWLDLVGIYILLLGLKQLPIRCMFAAASLSPCCDYMLVLMHILSVGEAHCLAF